MLARRVAVPALTAAALSTACLVPYLRRAAASAAGCDAPEPAESAAAKKARRVAVLEQRRLARNQLRSKRGRENRAQRNAAARAEKQAALDAMSSEEREREMQEQAARKEARLARQAAQEELVRTALASGQRICIDLSFDAEMSEKENRCARRPYALHLREPGRAAEA